MAGNPFNIDREFLAKELGFNGIIQNSLYGVSDRDFVAELLFWASMTMIHISRFSEDLSAGIKYLDWPIDVKRSQKNWINYRKLPVFDLDISVSDSLDETRGLYDARTLFVCLKHSWVGLESFKFAQKSEPAFFFNVDKLEKDKLWNFFYKSFKNSLLDEF